jgi:predicted metal-dependent phosphoesterase TrpH
MKPVRLNRFFSWFIRRVKKGDDLNAIYEIGCKNRTGTICNEQGHQTMIADLHIHTTASDGRLSPEAVLEQAAKAGLSHIAITDHDTLDGLLELDRKKIVALPSLTVIPGIECSAYLENYEVHILGYYIDIFDHDLQTQLRVLTDYRRRRVGRILEKLNQLGYELDYDDVLKIGSKATAIGRSHIAQALVSKGFFSAIADVFSALLEINAPAYVPNYKLTPGQVLALIKAAGGIPVLAHPGLIKNDDVVLDLIRQGICGIEAYHPRHDEQQIRHYTEVAARHRLFVTGGSDFHAIPGRFPEKLGIFAVPADIVYTMKNAAM